MPLDWHQRKPRKRISPTDRVSLKLSDRERALIIENTFAPDYLTRRLRLAVVGEKHPPVAFTLDGWDAPAAARGYRGCRLALLRRAALVVEPRPRRTLSRSADS